MKYILDIISDYDKENYLEKCLQGSTHSSFDKAGEYDKPISQQEVSRKV